MSYEDLNGLDVVTEELLDVMIREENRVSNEAKRQKMLNDASRRL